MEMVTAIDNTLVQGQAWLQGLLLTVSHSHALFLRYQTSAQTGKNSVLGTRRCGQGTPPTLCLCDHTSHRVSGLQYQHLAYDQV